MLPSGVEKVTMVPPRGIPQLGFAPALPPWASHSSAHTDLIQWRCNNTLPRAEGMWWGEAGMTQPASDSWKKQSRELSPRISFFLLTHADMLVPTDQSVARILSPASAQAPPPYSSQLVGGL